MAAISVAIVEMDLLWHPCEDESYGAATGGWEGHAFHV